MDGKLPLKRIRMEKISGVNGNFSEISNINLKEKINEKKAIKIVENEYKDNVNILKMGKTIFDYITQVRC